ncbi:hypothetical protein CFC21_050715 [Triticum aestivum]|uniref:Protein CHUP1, chloroplastic n=2 Tax=Triticum aestivum TaxID=4565 RepID=A0A3B6H3B0_WHEAT|nr:uncharacterized protein LOC123075960 isoform X1 [Triticum aestivum]KAF7040841.1 hypothetical protein CFC21_050715 [Triticum aestivum]
MGPLQAFWAWRTGEQSMPNIWRSLDAMDDQEGGLIFSVQFDPMRAGFDPTLISFPVPSLISRLLGWSNNSGQGRPQGSVMVVAAAVALYVAVLFVSGQQPRRRRLAASAAARPTSAVRLRPRALPLPAPDSGLLRILSWNNHQYLENVVHSASIGARDDEPVPVARVQSMPPDVAGATSALETKHGQLVKEEEVERFKELWLSLVEREQRLELRLMHLDGLREQLEHRVSVAAVETWILKLNALLLHEENERLKTQAAELEAVRAQLRRANEKLRALKERVQVERVESQREAAMLRDKVMDLELTGGRRERAFAAEAATLWKAKAGLEEENRELALRLQHAEQVSSSVTVSLVHEDDIVDEANYLREANDRLTRQIEQLRSDHCVHVEELVYLKWVNACLRHEIRGRDHHPSSAQQDQDGDGRAMTSAMDLSKSMSYRSSEKAKELMLRYGSLGLGGYDPALFSPLNETTDRDGKNHQLRFGDHDEPWRSPVMPPAVAATPKNPAGHGKLKFVRNIKKLLASRRRSQGHNHKSEKKAMRWLSSSSHDALSGDSSYESTPLSSCQRTRLSSVTTVDLDARARGGEAAAEVPVASRPEADTQG